jgi:hypothetical protein
VAQDEPLERLLSEVTVPLAEIWAAIVELEAVLSQLRRRSEFHLVFSRRLTSVEGPNGRRLIPRAAIEAWKTGEASVRA